MIHPHTELRSAGEGVGYGLFATRLIPKGTITWVQDALDIVLTPAQVSELGDGHRAILDRYAFVDAEGLSILCWDFGRFLNHSCSPNCLCFGDLVDVAGRDILPGEQLTCDYGLLNGEETFTCLCGAPGCLGRADRQAFECRAPEVDRVVLTLLPLIAKLDQPLKPFLNPDHAARLAAILNGTEPVPSCLVNLL